MPARTVMQFPYGPAEKREPDKPITTLDDCLRQAERLAGDLKYLASQKHPLAVRKGTSLKPGSAPKVRSRILKAGSKTYFFDIKRDKEDRPYLVITESRFQGEGRARERARLMVFAEHTRDFAACVTALVSQLPSSVTAR
jgi:hypothetical protein